MLFRSSFSRLYGAVFSTFCLTLSPSGAMGNASSAFSPSATGAERPLSDSLKKASKEPFSKKKTGREEGRRKTFFFPLAGKLHITSPYGRRVHPLSGRLKFHEGTDFRAFFEGVFAVLDGEVLESGWDPKGGGYYLKLKHPGDLVTSYLHLSERYYRVGEAVLAGYLIARSGNSGSSSGPHLHFAVHWAGRPLAPESFLLDQSLQQSHAAPASQTLLASN